MVLFGRGTSRARAARRRAAAEFSRRLTLISMEAVGLASTVRYARQGLRLGVWGVRSTRIAEIRGNALLIYKAEDAEAGAKDRCVHNAERTSLLDSNTVVEKVGERDLRIGVWDNSRAYAYAYRPECRLTFEDEATRELWFERLTEVALNEEFRAGLYVPRLEIGHGATSTVYLVEDAESTEYSAMKVVEKMNVLYSESSLKNVCAERVALASATSANSVFLTRLKDAFQSETKLYFVTELGEYGDLHTLLKLIPNSRLPEPVAKLVFAQMVMGLEELHSLGFLYRDLKPENIILTRSGNIKLTDFGLAKRLQVVEVSKVADATATSDWDSCRDDDSPQPQSLPARHWQQPQPGEIAPQRRGALRAASEMCAEEAAVSSVKLLGRANSFVGTRRFMAPEQLKATGVTMRGYGAPADVWALGVTLYMLLTGGYPLAQDAASGDTAAIFMAIREEAVKFPSWISRPAMDLILGMMDRDVGERMSIDEIKRSEWMRGVNFGQIRREARRNAPQKEMLALIKEAGVKSAVERAGGTIPFAAPHVYEEQRMSISKAARIDDTLWGFGYRGPTSRLMDSEELSFSDCSVGSG